MYLHTQLHYSQEINFMNTNSLVTYVHILCNAQIKTYVLYAEIPKEFNKNLRF